MFINTHFDHQSEPARIKSTEAMATLAKTFEKLPTIITGDFNSAAHKSGAYATLVGSGAFKDTWDATSRKLTKAFGTFPGYKDPVVGGDRIDWVLASPAVTILEAAINMLRVRGRYPSDHAPVHALVRLP